MSRIDSDTRSTESSTQYKNKAINSDSTNPNTISKKILVEKLDKETINNLKKLDRDETLKRLTDFMFNHKLNSTHALLMHWEMLNIKGLNEDSNTFQTEIKINVEENKGWNDENSAPNVQQFARDTKNK